MKPLVLALATALVGSGCYQPPVCTTRNVQVDWSQGFSGPGAASGQSCSAAGVTYVDIFINGQKVVGPVGNGHFACGDLAEIVGGLTDGATQVTTEGLAADGSTILYRDVQSFTASGCNDFLVTAAPAAGTVSFAYQFYSGPNLLPSSQQVCAGPYLWLSVYDRAAGAITVLSDLASNPTAYACDTASLALQLALPIGDYDLRWMEEHGASPGWALLSEDCTDRPFTVASETSTNVPVALDTVATSALCAP
jgi:hypothetical protein